MQDLLGGYKVVAHWALMSRTSKEVVGEGEGVVTGMVGGFFAQPDLVS